MWQMCNQCRELSFNCLFFISADEVIDEDIVITDENVEPELTVDVDESLFQDLEDLTIDDD